MQLVKRAHQRIARRHLFRRHKQDFQIGRVAPQVCHDRLVVPRLCGAGSQVGTVDARFPQVVDLVLNERNQGGDDHGDAWTAHCRELVAHAL